MSKSCKFLLDINLLKVTVPHLHKCVGVQNFTAPIQWSRLNDQIFLNQEDFCKRFFKIINISQISSILLNKFAKFIQFSRKLLREFPNCKENNEIFQMLSIVNKKFIFRLYLFFNAFFTRIYASNQKKQGRQSDILFLVKEITQGLDIFGRLKVVH